MKISRREMLWTLGGISGFLVLPGKTLASVMSTGSDSFMASDVKSILAQIYSGFDLYWGEIHGHTGFSDGYGLPNEYFDRARYSKLLDFAAISDHAEAINYFSGRIQMNDGSPMDLWQFTIDSADDRNVSGEFATLIGWEWTSDDYGHRNVYFRDSTNIPAHPISTEMRPHPLGLWGDLEGYSCLTIPHHCTRVDAPGQFPMAIIGGSSARLRNLSGISNIGPTEQIRVCLTDWDYTHEMERLVEIYSKWGSCETWNTTYEPMLLYRFDPSFKVLARTHDVGTALNRGIRLGIIAGSDTHQATVGSTKWEKPRGTTIGGDVDFLTGLTGEQFLNFHKDGYTLDFREPRPSGGGVFAAWTAGGLERENIFDAMYNRNVFGTTGLRPVVRFAVVDRSTSNTAIMGEEVDFNGSNPNILFHVLVGPGNGIDKIVLWRNTEPIAQLQCGGAEEASGVFEDINTEAGSTYYYRLKIFCTQTQNTDGDRIYVVYPIPDLTDDPQLDERVWTSPIWVTMA